MGIEDIRVSIDSSDIPHLHYIRGLIDGKIRNREDAKLIKEIEEAEHDLKRRRVIKAKNSTDDTFQAEVGAYFLSDTFGRNAGTAEGLYPKRTNLVGGQSMSKILKDLGYTN